MPLIDLKTKLKDLKFDTRAPYIVQDINNPPVYNSLSDPATRRRDDVLRLAKMLTDVPGARFASNQALLQAFNKTNYESDAKTILGQVAAILSNTVISTGRAAAITLAQAGIEGTGVRLTLPRPGSFYYTQNNPGSAATVSGPTVVNERGTQTVFSSRTSKYIDLSIEGTNNSGVGNVYEEDLNTRNFDASPNYLDLRDKGNQKGIAQPTKASTDAYIGKSIKVKTSSTYKFSTDKISTVDASDDINLLDVGTGLGKDNDLFPKIVFAKYDKKGTYTGTKVFRAFIGNISDTFSAKWTANEYVGRMEQFFVYTGFTRTLSLPLQVPIFSKQEQPLVYNKVNSLISHTAPEYTENSGIPSGIITYLEIGDYYKGSGVLNSVGVTVSNDVQWSRGPGKFDGKGLILPQVLSLNLQFTPIHEVTPQATFKTTEELETDQYGKFRYIGNARRMGKQPPKPENEPTTYTVKKGQGWSNIALDVYEDASRWPELQKANPGIDMLHPGTVVTIP